MSSRNNDRVDDEYIENDVVDHGNLGSDNGDTTITTNNINSINNNNNNQSVIENDQSVIEDSNQYDDQDNNNVQHCYNDDSDNAEQLTDLFDIYECFLPIFNCIDHCHF